MGGTISLGPSSLSERKRNLRNQKKEEERKRKQAQELLEKYGVLIPPVFLANQTDDPPLSSRVWERVLRESSAANLQGAPDLLPWAYRRTKPQQDGSSNNSNIDSAELDAGPLLGETLLTEYMTPGLFLSLPIAASGTNDGGRFLAALTHQPFSKDSQDSVPSFFSLTKCFHRNSSLFFPFPWKVETFVPQHALLSSSSAGSNSSLGILPSSMRFVADLSSPGNKNRTQVAWTTHLLDQDSGSGGRTSSFPLWTKLKGSWIQAETVRPDCWNSGITLRMASAMTMDCFVDHIAMEACRRGKDAYDEYFALQSSSAASDAFGEFLRKTKRNNSSPKDETIRIRLAAEYKESILASNTNISLASLLGRGSGTAPVVTVTDTLLSLNLNGGGGGGGGTSESDSDQQQQLPTAPPLWLTLKQSKSHTHSDVSSFTLNLSQVVTVDREIWNILEDRAPKVRNHVGWVCQIERFQKNHPSQEGDASSPSSGSILSVGASAQFNRNIAAKVILESKLGSASASASPSSPSTTTPTTPSPSAALKFALVLKRWLEPQASLSLLQKIDLRTGKWSFLGVGLEIEQQKAAIARESRPPSSTRSGTAEYRDTADMDSTSSVAPPTRVQVQLPGDKK